MTDTKKHILLYFMVGAGFGITAFIANAVLFVTLGVQLTNSTKNLFEGAFSANPLLFITAFISLAVTGLLLVLWASLAPVIGKPLGVHVTPPQKIKTEHKIGMVLTLVGLGIVTWTIIYGFNQAILGYDDSVNINDPFVLWNAITSQNLVLVIASFLAIMFFGAVLAVLTKAIHGTQVIADKLAMNH